MVRNAPCPSAPAERLPFADGAFDLVFCQFALLWLDAAAAVGEVRRVLSPGGVLAAIEPDYGGMIEHPRGDRHRRDLAGGLGSRRGGPVRGAKTARHAPRRRLRCPRGPAGPVDAPFARAVRVARRAAADGQTRRPRSNASGGSTPRWEILRAWCICRCSWSRRRSRVAGVGRTPKSVLKAGLATVGQSVQSRPDGGWRAAAAVLVCPLLGRNVESSGTGNRSFRGRDLTLSGGHLC